ncbi:hypothetical protein VTN31DRAFT_7397 [Thermomyces dupontii]|uniref:mitochondrial 54S ribosomal protein mL58 n=1 Tax=Talaromyces thermophilus TaxID=28565 RepID=UPI0037445510
MALVATPLRPVVSLSFLVPSLTELAAPSCRRYQSSYRRTKKRLRVKPDASFGPSNTAFDSIIYNPPPSAPNVFHTPTKFLPRDDVRRQLRQNLPEESSPENYPPMFKHSEADKKYHLTREDVEEIIALRRSDPLKWTTTQLAKKFQCSTDFITNVCQGNPELRAVQSQVLEAVKSRWGPKRRMAREDRQLRKEAWGRDE